MKTSKANLRFIIIVFTAFIFMACSSDDSSDTTPIVDSIEVSSIAPTSPETLNCGELVEFTFDYGTTEATGARIFGRPFTNGNLTLNYAAHSSPIHPVGKGTGNGSFTINTAGNVDQIRFQMFDASQSNLLFESFVDVDFSFVAHSVDMTSIMPASPSTINTGVQIQLTFDYKTIEAGGIRIFARPFTNGSLTPNYSASGSQVYPAGAGNGNAQFTLSSAAHVDQIRFRVTNADQSIVLLDYFVDVDYTFQ